MAHAMGQRGFTLLEVLLSVGIMSLILGVSLPVYQTFEVRNDLDITTQSVAEALRRAGVYSRGSKADATWGVHFDASSVVLFQGASYAARVTTTDETITTFPAAISSTFQGDVVFSKLTGYPSTTGTVTLASTGNDSRNIILNAKGMVSY